MRVPTTDYTPLRQANATKTQAERSKLIAPQMDNQRQSLLLNREAIKKKIGAVNTNLGFSMFQGAVNLGQLAVKAYDTVKSYQESLAENEGKKMASQWQKDVAGLIANGQLNISQSTDGRASFNPEGIQAVDQIQEAQLKHIDSQKWLPSVKAELKQRMQDFYEGREQSMLEAFYVKATEDGQLLDQAQMREAQDKDAAEWHYTDYRHFDEKVNSMNNLTENGKARLMMKGHEEIDFMRAANEVMDTATRKGQAAGVAKANEISDARDYNPDDRKKLEGYADGTARRAKAKAEADGMRDGASVIKNAQDNGMLPNFKDLYDQNENSNKNDEQKKAYRDGLESAQLDYLAGVYTKNYKRPEDMSYDELSKTVDNMQQDAFRDQFDGTSSSLSMFDRLISPYEKELDKRDRENASGEKLDAIYAQENALYDTEEQIDLGNITTEDQIHKIEGLKGNKDLGIRSVEDRAIRYLKAHRKAEDSQKKADTKWAWQQSQSQAIRDFQRRIKNGEKVDREEIENNEYLKGNKEYHIGSVVDIVLDVLDGKTEADAKITARDERQDAINNLKREIDNAPTIKDLDNITEESIRSNPLLQKNEKYGLPDVTQDMVDYLNMRKKNANVANAKQTSKQVISLMKEVKTRFVNHEITGNDAFEQMHSLYAGRDRDEIKNYMSADDYSDYVEKTDELSRSVSDELIMNNLYKQEFSECMKDIDKELEIKYKGLTSDKDTEERAALHDWAKGSLLDLAYDSKEIKYSDWVKRKNAIISILKMKKYDKLTSTGFDSNAYNAAMNRASEIENSGAVYFDERKDKLVWKDDDTRQAYKDATEREREMLIYEYGIDIDKEKPIEYRSITDKISPDGAEIKDFVPVFTDKEGDKYTVQDGKVYNYIPVSKKTKDKQGNTEGYTDWAANPVLKERGSLKTIKGQGNESVNRLASKPGLM